ncbi:hypothetical protein B0T22DRAFT_514214 [Podospora appendiculata]|uniref:Kinetochore protein mis14 n=1 Tax=Podospora appendiculata TaxID=314037 RepID=A0AAE1CDK0_9PEZI|nr:hypothetical protein B0T22DRAFT_514214 [Podospora appendiculata]
MDSSSAQHRPIELQSPEDFAYLINNVRRAAADSINAAFPPVADMDGADDHEDELRMRIEQMVNDYILKTFTLAAPSLTINGLPVDPSHFLSPTSGADTKYTDLLYIPHEQHEPFDARLRQRVEDLAREEEDLLRSIASLKRRVPRATASAWAAATKAGVAADEAALEAARARAVGDGEAAGHRALEGLAPLERQADVEGGFRRAVDGLGRLKRDMPSTVAKMERARVAGGYVVTGW